MYLMIEKEALAQDRSVAALGVASAIAQCFGGKKGHALEHFNRICNGTASKAGSQDTVETAELRQVLMDHIDLSDFQPYPEQYQ